MGIDGVTGLGRAEEHGRALAGKAVPVLYVLWSLWLLAVGLALLVRGPRP